MPILDVIRIYGKQLARVNAIRSSTPNFIETQFLGSVRTVEQEKLPFEKWQAHIKKENKKRKSLTSTPVIHIFA